MKKSRLASVHGLTGVVCLGTVLLSHSALAYPTTDQIIPTADILEPGQVRIELENDGAPRLFKKTSTSYFLTEVGLNKRMEVGVDAYDFSHKTTWALNAKYLLVRENGKVPAIAVGVADVGDALPPTTYGVATKAWGSLRGHFGAIHNSGDTFGIVGTDYKVNEKLYLLADWTTGPNGYASAGIYQRLPFKKLPMQGELWLNIGAGRPNNQANSNLVVLNIAYWFRP